MVFETVRGKLGPWIVGIIIGFIALVFIFSGVFTPSTTQGMHAGAIAGAVDGEAITVQEYQRALNQQMEFFKQFGGGQVPESMMGRIKENVFNDLVMRRLKQQEARKMGLTPSDEEIRAKVQEVPAFQKNGKFDLLQYKEVLAANGYSATQFEKMIREDLLVQKLDQYFRARVQVSETELKSEYALTNHRRKLKYVLFVEDGEKKDPAIEGLTNETLAQMKSADDPKADKPLNDKLKSKKTEVRTVSLTELDSNVPGIGEAPELLKEAFQDPSPLQGKAKKFQLPGRVVVAMVSKVEKPDWSKFELEKERLESMLKYRKEQELVQAQIKEATAKAKIEKNDAIIGAGAEG